MGDDIGWMQPSIYHRGVMVGETPNIDRIGNDGALFTNYTAMQSCTSGRNALAGGAGTIAAGASIVACAQIRSMSAIPPKADKGRGFEPGVN
jgi:arylsulfatase A-like enzyme